MGFSSIFVISPVNVLQLVMVVESVIRMCPRIEKMLFIQHKDLCPSLLPIAGWISFNYRTKLYESNFYVCKIEEKCQEILTYNEINNKKGRVYWKFPSFCLELRFLTDLQLHDGHWRESELDKLLRSLGNRLLNLGRFMT